MSITKTTIISNAISQLGHKPIQTLDNADDLVVSAEQAFDMLLPAVLSQSDWRFATQIAQLSKSVETPPTNTRWTTIYLLPANFLKNIRLYPHNYDYDIYENKKIYTNWTGIVHMEYVFEPDISKLTPSFVHYFTYEIAAYLALSNAQKTDFYSALEGKRSQALAMAAALDAQNRPNYSQATFPVLSNRNNFGENFWISTGGS